MITVKLNWMGINQAPEFGTNIVDYLQPPSFGNVKHSKDVMRGYVLCFFFWHFFNRGYVSISNLTRKSSTKPGQCINQWELPHF